MESNREHLDRTLAVHASRDRVEHVGGSVPAPHAAPRESGVRRHSAEDRYLRSDVASDVCFVSRTTPHGLSCCDPRVCDDRHVGSNRVPAVHGVSLRSAVIFRTSSAMGFSCNQDSIDFLSHSRSSSPHQHHAVELFTSRRSRNCRVGVAWRSLRTKLGDRVRRDGDRLAFAWRCLRHSCRRGLGDGARHACDLCRASAGKCARGDRVRDGAGWTEHPRSGRADLAGSNTLRDLQHHATDACGRTHHARRAIAQPSAVNTIGTARERFCVPSVVVTR